MVFWIIIGVILASLAAEIFFDKTHDPEDKGAAIAIIFFGGVVVVGLYLLITMACAGTTYTTTRTVALQKLTLDGESGYVHVTDRPGSGGTHEIFNYATGNVVHELPLSKSFIDKSSESPRLVVVDHQAYWPWLVPWHGTMLPPFNTYHFEMPSGDVVYHHMDGE